MNPAPMLLSITGDRPAAMGRRGWFKRLAKGVAKVYTAPARFAFKAATHYTPQAVLARQAVKFFKKKKRTRARAITPAELKKVQAAPAAPITTAPAAVPAAPGQPSRAITPEELDRAQEAQAEQEQPPEAAPAEEEQPEAAPAEEEEQPGEETAEESQPETSGNEFDFE